MSRFALPLLWLLGAACTTAETENPNAIDNDGDGLTELQGDCDDADAAVTVYTYYTDADLDHYGAGQALVSCEPQPAAGLAVNADDCDDEDADVYPGSSANDPTVCGHDDDGDGYVTEAEGGTDCDDGDADVAPGKAAKEPAICGPDADQDGYAPESYGGTDCDDADADMRPGASEPEDVCGIDADRDGFIAPTDGGTDCDDSNAEVSPDATEVGDNGIDDDCDPSTVAWAVIDSQSYSDELISGKPCSYVASTYIYPSPTKGDSGKIEVDAYAASTSTSGCGNRKTYEALSMDIVGYDTSRHSTWLVGYRDYDMGSGACGDDYRTWLTQVDSSGNNTFIAENPEITVGAWHTVTYQWDAGTASILLDGTIVADGFGTPLSAATILSSFQAAGNYEYPDVYGWCTGELSYSEPRL